MVFMTMGNKKSFYFIYILFQICDIRDNQVNSQHIVLRERQTAIHHNNAVLIFKSCNIHSDLLKSSQWNNLKLTILCCHFFLQIHSSFLIFYRRIFIRKFRKNLGNGIKFHIVFHHLIQDFFAFRYDFF